MENSSKYSPEKKTVLQGDGDNISEITMVDRSFLAPLIAEYDKYLEEVNGQLEFYQTQVCELTLQLENMTKENERLHSELKEAVVKQLEAFPSDSLLATNVYTDEEVVKNLQEQLQLANKEKNHVVELWQTVSLELETLQKVYQHHITDNQIYVFERQKQKDQMTSFKQLIEQLHVANETIGMIYQEFLKTVTKQNVEIEQLHKQLRLYVAVQEADQLKIEKANLEKQTKELQIKCADLENEKYEAILRSRDSMQLLEEANLQKNQALLEEKQKEEDIKKIKETISQLVHEAAVRTRKELRKLISTLNENKDED